VTSNVGLLPVRELGEHLGKSTHLRTADAWSTQGEETVAPPDLLRQVNHGRLAGYRVVYDAQRLAQDPTFLLMGLEKTGGRGGLLNVETELLTPRKPAWARALSTGGRVAKMEFHFGSWCRE